MPHWRDLDLEAEAFLWHSNFWLYGFVTRGEIWARDSACKTRTGKSACATETSSRRAWQGGWMEDGHVDEHEGEYDYGDGSNPSDDV